MNPDSVDFTDPGMPPNFNAEKVRGEIEPELQHLRDQGWQAEHCTIEPDASAGPTVERFLATSSFDCIIIGAGVRLPVHQLQVFEAVVNAVHKAAPATRIAFNTSLNDSADAVDRLFLTHSLSDSLPIFSSPVIVVSGLVTLLDTESPRL